MRRMKKARQYLLGIFAALLLCGIFSVNTVKADTQYVYDMPALKASHLPDMHDACQVLPLILPTLLSIHPHRVA